MTKSILNLNKEKKTNKNIDIKNILLVKYIIR